MKRTVWTIVFTIVSTVYLVFCVSATAGNIDPANGGHKYAYAENAGWVNLAPSFGTMGNVEDGKLSGYIWSESIGWVTLDPLYGGVSNDGKGNLSGYAWSENTGWINFSCKTDVSCNTVEYGVTIDTTTGLFSGNAWGENIGWINFEYTGFSSAENTYAETIWRVNGDVNSSGTVTLEDVIISLQICTDLPVATKVHSGADVQDDNRIGLEEAIYIMQHISKAKAE